jgi:hypothetical protein
MKNNVIANPKYIGSNELFSTQRKRQVYVNYWYQNFSSDSRTVIEIVWPAVQQGALLLEGKGTVPFFTPPKPRSRVTIHIRKNVCLGSNKKLRAAGKMVYRRPFESLPPKGVIKHLRQKLWHSSHRVFREKVKDMFIGHFFLFNKVTFLCQKHSIYLGNGLFQIVKKVPNWELSLLLKSISFRRNSIPSSLIYKLARAKTRLRSLANAPYNTSILRVAGL